MNETRYQELLGRVLDEEIGPKELDDLSGALRRDPDRLRDLQTHLVLWDLFSQQHRPERSAEAFASAWRTRLMAESDAPDFLTRTVDLFDAGEPETTIAGEPAAPSVGGEVRERAKSWLWWIPGLIRSANKPAWAAGFALATCLIVIVWVGTWWFFPAMGEPVLGQVQGAGLSLERAGQLLTALADAHLQTGDILRTPETATATIIFPPEKTRITAQPGTELKLLSVAHGKHFDLAIGRVEASVARQRPFRPLLLTTPQAEARVLGTRFSLLTRAGSTRLEVIEGQVRLTRLTGRESVNVSAGHYAVVTTNTVLAPLPLTGSIYREYWTNVPGSSWTSLVTDPRFSNRPDGWGCVTNLAGFELPPNWAHNYGERLRGYLHPPKTGEYTFWIAAQADGSLFLSPNENPADRLQMAYSAGAHPRNWHSDLTQRSSSVPLTAGKKYYFEVLHKVDTGNDNLAVAWQGPDRERELIPTEFLSPFRAAEKGKKP